jgi:hypothetical protein
MSRRDYEATAKAVASMLLNKRQRAYVAEVLANAFAKDNPRFDHDRFHHACGTWHPKGWDHVGAGWDVKGMTE